MEPAHAAGKNFLPIEIAGFEKSASLIRPVVKYDRRADALAAITVYRRHIRSVDAIMLEVFIERLHPHGFHPFRDQIADGIVHHGGRNSRFQSETIGQIGGAVELATAHMDQALRRFAERNDSGIQTMDQGAYGNKIQCSFFANVQPDSIHNFPPQIFSMSS